MGVCEQLIKSFCEFIEKRNYWHYLLIIIISALYIFFIVPVSSFKIDNEIYYNVPLALIMHLIQSFIISILYILLGLILMFGFTSLLRMLLFDNIDKWNYSENEKILNMYVSAVILWANLVYLIVNPIGFNFLDKIPVDSFEKLYVYLFCLLIILALVSFILMVSVVIKRSCKNNGSILAMISFCVLILIIVVSLYVFLISKNIM